MTGFINCVKTFGLNPEGNGMLSKHLWVRFEFWETCSGYRVEERLELGQAECRQDHDVDAQNPVSKRKPAGVPEGTARVTWIFTSREVALCL